MIATVHVEVKDSHDLGRLTFVLSREKFSYIVGNEHEIMTLEDAKKIQTFMHYDPDGKPTVFG
jgi:hypothetical protein